MYVLSSLLEFLFIQDKNDQVSKINNNIKLMLKFLPIQY